MCRARPHLPHPLRQPALLLRGRPIGEVPVQLMSPLQAADVVLEDTAHCKLNGQVVAPSSLGAQLATMRREYVELELANDGLTMRRVLDFRIAEEADLAGVEAAFERLADERALNIDSVSRFTKECRAFATAMPYCDGICHYLYGVMAKEHSPDSGLPHEQYSERYHRAVLQFKPSFFPRGFELKCLNLWLSKFFCSIFHLDTPPSLA
jgi:hypothetical protein